MHLILPFSFLTISNLIRSTAVYGGAGVVRLLQLLGEHVDDEKKVIIFVDTQVRADSVFEQLTRCGYSSLSLHGGK